MGPLRLDAIGRNSFWRVSQHLLKVVSKQGFEQLLERTARWPGQPNELLEGLLAVLLEQLLERTARWPGQANELLEGLF